MTMFFQTALPMLYNPGRIIDGTSTTWRSSGVVERALCMCEAPGSIPRHLQDNIFALHHVVQPMTMTDDISTTWGCSLVVERTRVRPRIQSPTSPKTIFFKLRYTMLYNPPTITDWLTSHQIHSWKSSAQVTKLSQTHCKILSHLGDYPIGRPPL